jgi:hypothetical protein
LLGQPVTGCPDRAAEELLQRGVDRGELGSEVRAESIYDGNDRERNAGGNQAILDGRRAAFVLQKPDDECHVRCPAPLSKKTVLDRKASFSRGVA